MLPEGERERALFIRTTEKTDKLADSKSTDEPVGESTIAMISVKLIQFLHLPLGHCRLTLCL